jgi:type IV secretory pathway VirB4 component
MLDEYKTKTLTPKSIFLINANHYIVGAVGSGKTTLMSKLIELYKHKINAYILYFSNLGPYESMLLNMNDKNISINNITYDDAMIFLP